jgi:hypothetical protein
MRIIPRLEQHPALVGWVQTPPGKIACVAVFAGFLWVLRAPLVPLWREITIVVGLLTLFPSRRRVLLTLTGIYWLAAHAVRHGPSRVIELVARSEGLEGTLNVPFVQIVSQFAAFALCVAIAVVVFRHPRDSQLKPVRLLLLSYMSLLILVDQSPIRGISRVVLWGVTANFGAYIWYLGYTLHDRDARARDSVPLQVGAWFPFWLGTASTLTPFPKGAAYLRKIEAKTSEELAITQLKAIKLLAWVCVLQIASVAFVLMVHGSLSLSSSARESLGPVGFWLPPGLGLPTFPEAFEHSLLRIPYPWYLNWASLFSAFVRETLEISVWGGIIVACIRMAGFRALRNTYRPLQSRTIAEFWNRYYYYFKELLVELFFFPIYMRYFKRHPRLRLAVATMAAACFGNMLFHFL